MDLYYPSHSVVMGTIVLFFVNMKVWQGERVHACVSWAVSMFIEFPQGHTLPSLSNQLRLTTPQGRKLRFRYLSPWFPPGPPLVARQQRPEENETPRRAAVSVTMATVWVIQVEVRENSLFFPSFCLLSSLLFCLLLFTPPLLSLFLSLFVFYSCCLSFSLPLCQLSTFFPPPFPSHPLLFRFSVMVITERIREKDGGSLISTHWSLHNKERLERLTESNRLLRRCTHIDMHFTRRHSPLRLSLFSLAGSS